MRRDSEYDHSTQVTEEKSTEECNINLIGSFMRWIFVDICVVMHVFLFIDDYFLQKMTNSVLK